jgi:thiamine biosynthesis lipoprotein
MEKLLEITRSFRAMNTDIEVILCVADEQQQMGERAIKSVQILFEKVEETLSRFKPQSELSRLNRSGGSSFEASPLLLEVVKASLKAAHTTRGVFDPTILPGLLASGYDRSFEKLAEMRGISRPNIPGRQYRFQDIRLSPQSSSILMPKGCQIDLGGIGKGWTVDQACWSLKAFTSYAVDAGGDMRVKGKQVGGTSWTIGVADPFVEGHDLTRFDLSEVAVCTSTTTRRKWESEGRLQHHIIDPGTGRPSQSGVVSATVIAESAVRAEIISKTAIILGPKAGLRFIESQAGTRGLLVLEDGRLLHSQSFLEVQHVA